MAQTVSETDKVRYTDDFRECGQCDKLIIWTLNVQKTCLETAQPNQERYALIGSVTKAGEQV